MIHTVSTQVVSDYIQTYRNKYNMNKNHQLLSIYKTIVAMNKQSPVYMLQMSTEKQTYALTLKDSAIGLNHILSEYYNTEGTSVFDLRKATSNNELVVNAQLIDDNCDCFMDELAIKVKRLASSQINVGYEVSSQNKSLPIGAYSFTVDIEDKFYEFQYNVTEKLTNKENIKKLTHFINQSNIGLLATLSESSKNESSQIIIKSAYTGALNLCTFTFHDTISPDPTRGVVDYLGFNNVAQYPKNSCFELNGVEKESLSNSFTYNKSLKITLNSVSDDIISIGFVPDTDRILNNLSHVVNSYNHLIDVISKQALTQKASKQLLNEFNTLFNEYHNELESCGLIKDAENKFAVEEAVALSAAMDGSIEKLLTSNDGYVKRVQYKMEHIMLNPMNYLDKTIVTYPNTKKLEFPDPYISSVYCGMLYNFYC